MSQRLPSLELVAGEVEAQRQEQLRHFEGLDVKAGIVLGFAGALVALAGRASSLFDLVGSGLAVASALCAVLTFLPRDFPVLDIGLLRDRYLVAESQFTTLFLLDTRLQMWRQGTAMLDNKAFRLKLALAFLALSSAAFLGGIIRLGG